MANNVVFNSIRMNMNNPRWVVKVEDSGIQSTVVHNSLAKQLGMSEDKMFKAAVENTRRIFPPRIRNMNDVIKDMPRLNMMKICALQLKIKSI